ncbi:MAG: hypothetical protein IPM92_10425 [Saprospiraceae bacterium]|nr:hypothetical protein [Saprospiraceae bacterium]
MNILDLFANQNSDSIKLHKQLLKAFPDIKIESMPQQQPFQFVWKLWIQQAKDHWNADAGFFRQQVLLYHRGFKKPNVLVTEGYNINDRIYEPSLILDGNQISVEYRFYGASKPLSIPWKLLNHKQALHDYYKIQKGLQLIYKKNWLVTGISKGGTTAALYSLTYPDLVNATIAYVAPFVTEQEDKRTIDHYTKWVGSPECRQKVKSFQRLLLNYRVQLKPMLSELGKRDQVKFELDLDKVIDYTALEYPFSFWQWGFGCKEIPDEKASVEEVFDHVEEVVDFNYYDDRTCALFLPAYFQFMTEYGYYGFDTTGLSNLLLHQYFSNLEFCPKDADLGYNGSYMKEMLDKATNQSKNIIYIYGGLDTWTSCAVHPSPTTNAFKLVKYNGGHRTRLRDFSKSEKDQVYKLLKKWMRTNTEPLPY